VWENLETAPISDRLKAYLRLAAKVQKSGRLVTSEDVKMARKHGAQDADIHDIVLIAAAFCLFNRYVDGLATMAPPRGDLVYVKIGEDLAETGYINAIK
jgi:alkylhydroperoxidase family enzyme